MTFFPLRYDISEINLPSIDDPELIQAYHRFFALYEPARLAVQNNKLVEFIEKHSFFAAYGFHKGFGTQLFNSMIQDAYNYAIGPNELDKKWFYKTLSFQILRLANAQVSDPEYLNLVQKFILNPEH